MKGIKEIALRLKELGIAARFPKTRSIHLTLKFLGDIDESMVERVKQVLERSDRSCGCFDLHVEGLGVFPSLRKPRIVWVGVRRESALDKLQRGLEASLQVLGFEAERRPFRPHLTVARLKSSRNISELQCFLESEGRDFAVGSFAVDAIHLYRSVLHPDGPEYQKLSTCELGVRGTDS